ncbi:hypothetical protein FHL15_007122 [Xylaria flabelliformis]|uniref:Uncharacterized protein n=1 Tax=Xylaria flabelliformis TaxID=2512241 RepID=A0A553HVQ2_9PEZI|nr:hypothetical protein FHL15_007122 [Xylaria flabelliformis]
MNKYWIPHHEINKKVITQELQCYLGPEATGEDGYLITTPGACLTDEQIDDICLKSKELWERQAAAKAQQNLEKPLKRPLHQPVLISKGSGSGSGSGTGSVETSKRRNTRRGVSKRAYTDRRGPSGFGESIVVRKWNLRWKFGIKRVTIQEGRAIWQLADLPCGYLDWNLARKGSCIPIRYVLHNVICNAWYFNNCGESIRYHFQLVISCLMPRKKPCISAVVSCIHESRGEKFITPGGKD